MTAHVNHNTGNNEWYTPEVFIKSARAVMGRIDVDPASNDIAQKWIDAGKYYTKDDDGLRGEWKGSVWLNPPYSSVLIRQFVEKLRIELFLGNTKEFILLCNNATETKWFKTAVDMSGAICFVGRRIQFIAPDGTCNNRPLQGNAILYGGPNVSKFDAEFGQHGFVVITQKRRLKLC